MVNGACGGNLVTKTVAEAYAIFKELAEGARTKGKKSATRKLHAIGTSHSELEQKVDSLTEMIKSMVVNTSTPSIMKKVCGICTSPMHPTDACPTLQEDMEQVNAVGFHNQGFQRKYDPFSNTYNPGWRDHPNFRYGGNQRNQGNQFQQQRSQFQRLPV